MVKSENRLIVLVIVLALSLISSCKKEDKGYDYNYFVSLDKVLSLNETYIGSMLTSAASVYPVIAELSPYSDGGVEVFRIVYKTEVNGQQINASGLVSFPSVPGEYPVLSFQNGTNTVDAYAPSNFPVNSSYQLIEIMASMGYIVLIPDYPGFGSSSEIPHPYLISEPTAVSIIDMFYALREMTPVEKPGFTVKNEFYLMGYSQGGWATMVLHKALELNYQNDFNLAGSVCGAGPYDINFLLQSMTSVSTYPMPAYIGYIVSAYTSYGQFTIPLTDIMNQPYASRLGSLFNGTLDLSAINSQLTTSVSGLLNPEFISGFAAAPKYSSVRDAVKRNSVTAWHTYKPLLMVHGGGDTQVNPQVTNLFYDQMISAGTSSEICKKEILPGLDHGDGVVPAMVKGFLFLRNISQHN
jgi:pimeloyl-ACP methyl ester carboxylesterase